MGGEGVGNFRYGCFVHVSVTGSDQRGADGVFYPHRGESKAARCPAVPRHSACSGPAGLQQVTWAPSKKLHHHQLAVACGVARARERQHQTVPGHTVMLMPCNAAAPCPVFLKPAGRPGWLACDDALRPASEALFLPIGTRHVPLALAAVLTDLTDWPAGPAGPKTQGQAG